MACGWKGDATSPVRGAGLVALAAEEDEAKGWRRRGVLLEVLRDAKQSRPK